MQEHIYSIQPVSAMGYICPMGMTFKEALEHAMKVTGRGKSVRDVALRSGVSYDILKNIRQSKSEKPNAEAATKVAEFFGVSLSDFYAGHVSPEASDDLAGVDVSAVTDVVRQLKDPSHRDQVRAFAKALLQTEEASRQAE